MNDWSGVTSETLSLIYYSLDFESHSSGRRIVWFNQPTWEQWEEILAEIGSEIDRRRDNEATKADRP